MKSICILLCCWLLCSLSQANNTLEVSTGEYSPYTSEALPLNGAISEIMRRTLEIANIKADINFYPWTRAKHNLDLHIAMASFPWARTDERAKDYLFVPLPIADAPTAVFYRQSVFPKGIAFNDYASLKHYKAVGIDEYWYIEQFKIQNMAFQQVVDSQSAIRFLAKNRADIYIDSLYVGLHEITQFAPELAEDLGYSLLVNAVDPHFYIMLRKDYPDVEIMLQKLTAALQQLHDSGEYQQLMQLAIP